MHLGAIERRFGGGGQLLPQRLDVRLEVRHGKECGLHALSLRLQLLKICLRLIAAARALGVSNPLLDGAAVEDAQHRLLGPRPRDAKVGGDAVEDALSASPALVILCAAHVLVQRLELVFRHAHLQGNLQHQHRVAVYHVDIMVEALHEMRPQPRGAILHRGVRRRAPADGAPLVVSGSCFARIA